MKFVPYADRIVVKEQEWSNKSKGGLFLPDTSERRRRQGTVIAVGPGPIDEFGNVKRPMLVQAGDVVLYPNLVWDEIVVDDEKLLVIREADIIGKLEQEDTTSNGK